MLFTLYIGTLVKFFSHEKPSTLREHVTKIAFNSRRVYFILKRNLEFSAAGGGRLLRMKGFFDVLPKKRSHKSFFLTQYLNESCSKWEILEEKHPKKTILKEKNIVHHIIIIQYT